MGSAARRGLRLRPYGPGSRAFFAEKIKKHTRKMIVNEEGMEKL